VGDFNQRSVPRFDPVRFVRSVMADLFRSRAALLAENAMLRQQLIVAERKLVGRVRWLPWQRFAMAIDARLAPEWRTVTFLVQPATKTSAGIVPDFGRSGGDVHGGRDGLQHHERHSSAHGASTTVGRRADTRSVAPVQLQLVDGGATPSGPHSAAGIELQGRFGWQHEWSWIYETSVCGR
jgi:hypothetical protein